MKKFSYLALLLSVLSFNPLESATAGQRGLFSNLIDTVTGKAYGEVRESIVQVFTTHQHYSYTNPWNAPRLEHSRGTGCIVEQNLILTNAHVVENAVFIEVSAFNSHAKVEAKILYIDHNVDLALLEVSDPTISALPALEIGKSVNIADEIHVYGFPMGGEGLSVTKGIVSRAGTSFYAHSHHELESFQIDAAINPGNSGGPAIFNNKIVGIVMQGIAAGDGLGYIIPSHIVSRFLDEELSHRENRGIPDPGISAQTMDNADLRKYYGLDDSRSGILISDVSQKSSASGQILPGDILLSIDGLSVDNYGFVKLSDGQTIRSQDYIHRKNMGDLVSVSVLRNKTEIEEISFPLTSVLGSHNLVPRKQYDKAPRYFIGAGLVFQPLNENYLEAWGDRWRHHANKLYLKEFIYGKVSPDQKELVILNKVLPSPLNAGYSSYSDNIVTHINNQKITSLEDVVRIFDQGDEQFINIRFSTNLTVVIDRAKAEKAQDQILGKYFIDSDRRLGE